MKVKRWLCLLLLLVAAAGWPYTETFYVCQGGDGSDPESGVAGEAWDADDFNTAGNWASGVDADDGKIGANDLVLVLDDGGVITSTGGESGAVFWFLGSGSEGKPITVKAADGESPILDGENGDGVQRKRGIRVHSSTAQSDYVILEGLEVRNAYIFGINLQNTDYWTIRDMKVHDVLNSGVNDGSCILFYRATNCTVEYNELYNTLEDHGIYFSGPTDSSDNIVQYNYIHDTDSAGVAMNGVDEYYTGCVIRYNWIEDVGNVGIRDNSGNGTEIYGNIFVAHDNVPMAILISGDGVGAATGTNAKIYNNVMYGNFNRMVQLGGTGADNGDVDSMYNNIFYQTSGNATHYFIYEWNEDGSTLSACDYNQFFNTQGGDTNRFYWSASNYASLSAWTTAYPARDGNSDDSNPLFTTPGSDFTLQEGSPCIDVASDLGATWDDMIDPEYNSVHDFGVGGNIGLLDQDDNGEGWEMGAYVYEASPSSKLVMILGQVFDFWPMLVQSYLAILWNGVGALLVVAAGLKWISRM